MPCIYNTFTVWWFQAKIKLPGWNVTFCFNFHWDMRKGTLIAISNMVDTNMMISSAAAIKMMIILSRKNPGKIFLTFVGCCKNHCQPLDLPIYLIWNLAAIICSSVIFNNGGQVTKGAGQFFVCKYFLPSISVALILSCIYFLMLIIFGYY